MELYSRQAFTTSQDEATKFGAWMSLWMLKKWRTETYKFTAQQQKSSASPKTAVNMLQSIYLLWLTHQHVDYNRLCINIQSVAKEKSCICRIPIYTVNYKENKSGMANIMN